MTDPKLLKLRRLALEATPGERIQYGDEVRTRSAELTIRCYGVALNQLLSKNAAFIAAANPDAVIALLDRLASAEEALSNIRLYVDEQAEDDGLWSVSLEGLQPIGEAYLQQELRKLHEVVESNCAHFERYPREERG